MSSSGLIYAVIVGAWAAYLVPMWLRRQDELNEARPTERFSTAIRLLSGRAAMERRYAKSLDDNGSADTATADRERGRAAEATAAAADDPVDVRGLAVPVTEIRPAATQAVGPKAASGRPATGQPAGAAKPKRPGSGSRAKLLARRRRTTTLLFLAFTAGSIIAAVGGLAFFWAPAAPATLLTVYIGYLRGQERRRFEVKLDQRRAADAARRLRERSRPASTPEEPAATAEPDPAPSPRTADRRALVEQTDHQEWVDQQREQRAGSDGDGWDPVPVPLPTYVTAPVAPRTSSGIDLGAPGTWSSARSGTSAEPEPDRGERPRPTSSRRTRDHSRTPLFDQYASPDRPRAANE